MQVRIEAVMRLKVNTLAWRTCEALLAAESLLWMQTMKSVLLLHFTAASESWTQQMDCLLHTVRFCSHSGEEHLFLKLNLKALLYVMPSYLATCLKVCDWDVHQTPYIWLHGARSDRSEIWLIWHLNFILMKYLTCRIFYPTLMYVRLSLPNVLFSTSWVWSCFILRISYARRSLSCTFHLFWIISKWNQWLEVQEDVAVVQSSI